MSDKIGRNEPCPCGSGRKYKNCCGRNATASGASSDSHENAVARSMAWLTQHHRKAFGAALEMALDDALDGLFDDEEQVSVAFDRLDHETWTHIQINLAEWLLAEGDIEVKGEFVRVAELLLGPRGPLLAPAQRAWIAQLSQRPLRLYDITNVIPGESITLCDALDTDAPPRVVVERSGSQTLRPGMQIGARVMELPGQLQLSGAIYPFSMLGGHALLQEFRAGQAEAAADAQAAGRGNAEGADDAGPMLMGLAIIDTWLEQLLVPQPVPDIVHASTGEPLVLTSDQYAVNDWAALTAALAAQADVEGDREAGWNRLQEGEDGSLRSLASINAEPGGLRVSVLYPTAGLAAQGRPWFDALAGGSVKFLLQEVSDPKGILSRPGAMDAPPTESSGLPDGFDPAAMADIVEAALKRSYARWADEPIPALGNQTPRAAIESAAGLERVKGLLRSYEDGEARQAAQQGRREISYQFLWDALGLVR